jgi:hypothetical protein
MQRSGGFFFTPAKKNQQVQEADGTADAADGDVCIGEKVYHGSLSAV